MCKGARSAIGSEGPARRGGLSIPPAGVVLIDVSRLAIRLICIITLDMSLRCYLSPEVACPQEVVDRGSGASDARGGKKNGKY